MREVRGRARGGGVGSRHPMQRRDVRFQDRRDAGRALAGAVAHLRAEAPVVLGLPRGGVVVAAEVARALQAPLDVVIVRKLGAPFQPEYAIGAIGEAGGGLLLNPPGAAPRPAR